MTITADSQQFSCFIIGDTSLPIQCAEALRQADHIIYGVISDNAPFRQWAEQHQIPVYRTSDNLTAILKTQPFDYLFSIFSLTIIPNEVLALPLYFAINCHDAPLPRYAGLYATAWALLNRETQHAVSWHVITEGIDEGDILKQRFVEIAPTETAVSLNLKIYEAAVTSFRELIGELAAGRATRIVQDLTQRTYFARNDRPQGGGIISWRKPAAEIDALCRALTSDVYINPLGRAKVLIGDDLYIVAEHELLMPDAPAVAGVIRSMDAVGLTIVTVTSDIRLKKLLTIEGEAITFEQIAQRYGLLAGDMMPELDPAIAPELTRQHREIAKHESFWRKRLAAIQPLELPFAVQNAIGDTVPVMLSFTLNVSGVLPENWNGETFLLAVFLLYLARLNNLNPFDIAFTTPELRERLTSLAPVGENFFASQVPLHVELSKDGAFAQVYEAVEKELTLCRRRLTYSRDVVTCYPELNSIPRIDGSASIAIELLRSWAEPLPDVRGGLTFCTADFPEGGEPRATFVYNPSIIQPADVERMVGHLQSLSDGILSTSIQPITQLPLLTPAEYQQIIHDWNGSDMDYGDDLPFHILFEQQVGRTPDNIAVVFGDEQLTYAELNARANQLAHYLQSIGVQPQMMIGIIMDRSIDFLVAMFGVLKAGGVFVSIDKAHPASRIAYMLENSGAFAVITQRALQPRLPAFEGAMLVLEDLAPTLIDFPAENPASGTKSDDLMCVLYTSGSTGNPKGVMLEHGSLLNYFKVRSEVEYGLSASDVGTSAASIGFDTIISETFSSLLVGARLIIIPVNFEVDVAYFWSLVERHHVTYYEGTPSVWSVLLQGLKPMTTNSLRYVSVGGEALTPELRRRHAMLLPNTELSNGYGPTEASIVVTYEQSLPPVDDEPDLVTLGRPIANVRLYILDAALQPVPRGVVGTIYIGGKALARGYINRPDLTAEKFIEHPQFGRIYNTGDLGRWLPDGNITYQGREDFQVKLRGLRIELGEISGALLSHPAVEDAVVIAHEGSPGDMRLVAYIVLKPDVPDSEFSEEVWRSHLRRTLPEYMVPVMYVKLDALPLTANGKLDRRALPVPRVQRSGAAVVLPRTLTEGKLLEIWSDILKIETISVEDDYFKLGGDSLGAARIVGRIAQEMQVTVPLVTFLKSPTIAGMAALIDDAQLSADDAMVVTLKTGDLSRTPLFLIHTLYGDVFHYRELVEHLPLDQPVYGIQIPRDDTSIGFGTLEELARHYVEAVESIYTGQVYLAGHSFGGFAAYEMAQQLTALGKPPLGIFIVDSWFRIGAVSLVESQGHRLRSIWNSVRSQTPSQQVAFIRKRLAERRKKSLAADALHERMAQAQAKLDAYDETIRESGMEFRRVRAAAFREMTLAYEPHEYRGEVAVFISESTYSPNIKKWWSYLVKGQLDVMTVTGDHLSMLRQPHVRIIAERIKTVLVR